MDAVTKRIAMARISQLFRMANEIFQRNPSLAQRYVSIARKIAMATTVPLPTEHRRQVCKHCKSFIVPGANCRVRIKQRREPHITITCLHCGLPTRIPLRKRAK